MPEPALAKLTRATMIVFGPSVRMRSRNESSNPRMIELIPTIAVMPMTTPRTVSPERILFARIVPRAMPDRVGEECDSDHRTLFPSQRFDRVEPAPP